MLVLLTVLGALLLSTNAQTSKCQPFCKYRFCQNLLRDGPVLQPENRALLLGVPDSALGPIPCVVSSDGEIRFLTNVTGGEATVARANSSDPFVPISRFQLDAVAPPFPPGFFSWVENTSNGRESIARDFSSGNQEDVIDQVCVRMPVKSFDVRHKDGSVQNRVFPKGDTACIGFRTMLPMLLVDFEWTTTNDFDLRLKEPNGFQINRFGPTNMSPNGGKLVFDAGGTTCQVEFGRERIRYLKIQNAVVEPGTYTISVDHLRSCSRTSAYKLKVYYQGELLLNESGTLSEVGESVLVRTFDI